MDKLKIYLAWLVKHHFWVLSGTTVILALVGWFLAANHLAAYFKDRKTKIDTEFAKTRQIIAKENHPNPTFEAGVNKLLDQPGVGLKTRVFAAWRYVYDHQKNKVLQWPPEMGEDFLEYIQNHDTGEIPVDFRERYFNYVRLEFPKLLTIVKAQNHADLNTNRFARGPDDRDEPVKKPKESIVIWKADDQTSLDEALDWPRAPQSDEMRRIQENLWVYKTLLSIIARVNENATGHYNAKIKEIIALQIARPAAQEFQAGMSGGKLILPQMAGPSPGGPGAPGGMAPPPGAPPGGAPAGGMPAAAGGRLDLANRGGGGGGRGSEGGGLALASVQESGRYVDGNGAPLADNSTAPPEFKRMPVLLQLYMDQREISRLLVECADAPLPIEVKQLRIDPPALRRSGRTDVTSLFAGGGGKASGQSRGGLGMMGGGGGMAGGGLGMAGGGADAADRALNPYDMPVEIQGIIYIFNPPNRAKLAIAGQPFEEKSPEGGMEKESMPEETPEETPAETTPAETAPAETAPVAGPSVKDGAKAPVADEPPAPKAEPEEAPVDTARPKPAPGAIEPTSPSE